MEENLKNKFGFWVFILLILTLAIGGYFFTRYILNINDGSNGKINNLNGKENYKINEDEDYIYYINEEVISEGAEIYYKDVIINFNTQRVLNESLEKENKIYKNNIKYITDMNLINNEIINYNNDNLYALNFREYKTYEFDKYISLVINDYYYSCFDLITFDNVKSYVFNVENGQLLQEEQLLKLYNQSMESIKENIRSYLTSIQSAVDGVELIKIEDTLEDFKGSLYINEYGKLYITYLVKTTQVDYNEVMEVN